MYPNGYWNPGNGSYPPTSGLWIICCPRCGTYHGRLKVHDPARALHGKCVGGDDPECACSGWAEKSSETKVCAVCGQPEQDLPVMNHQIGDCSKRGPDGLCQFDDEWIVRHHPFIEAHCADCGQTQAQLDAYYAADGILGPVEMEDGDWCRRHDAHSHKNEDGVRYFLAIEDRIKAAYVFRKPIADDTDEDIPAPPSDVRYSVAEAEAMCGLLPKPDCEFVADYDRHDWQLAPLASSVITRAYTVTFVCPCGASKKVEVRSK